MNETTNEIIELALVQRSLFTDILHDCGVDTDVTTFGNLVQKVYHSNTLQSVWVEDGEKDIQEYTCMTDLFSDDELIKQAVEEVLFGKGL